MYAVPGNPLSHSLLSRALRVNSSGFLNPNQSTHSSVSNTMLGRAAKEYEPPPSKSDLNKLLFPSSSPNPNGDIQKQFQMVRQSTQSIGGFMNHTNTLQSFRAQSPINKQSLAKKPPCSSNTSSYAFSTGSSTRLFSVLGKKDPFRDPGQVMDHNGEVSNTSSTLGSQLVEFNEDDFEFDDDLDLDLDYDLPISMTEPLKPLQNSNSLSMPPASVNPTRDISQSSQNPTSSAVTWPSSPPSHKMNPLAMTRSLKRDSEMAVAEGSTQPINPTKRRTLPWLQQEAEKDQIALVKKGSTEEVGASGSLNSPQTRHLFRGNQIRQYSKDYLVPEEKDSRCNYSRPPKHIIDQHMPWDNTQSAINEGKKKLKDRKKNSKKDDEGSIENRANRTTTKTGLTPISLTDEQQKVLDLVVNQSKSVFFTGSAGTGKSVLMRAIIAELRRKYAKELDRIAVTASTGLAACNIGGITLHSFGGIGLGKDDVPSLVIKIKRNLKAKNRWIKTKVLIIDEISMVDGDLFDKLEGIARAMRNDGRPFGGIQLVITGDFFQLPPVPEYDNKNRGIKFAFDAITWPTAIHHTIGLTQVFRQKDPLFANMLNEMRLGKITEETITAFRRLSRSISEDGFDATELFPTRNEVDNANAFRMRDLHGPTHKYIARDTGMIQDTNIRDKLLANVMAPKTLELKKGAQVMLIKNLDDGLVNGTLGIIQNFMSEKDFKFLGETPNGLQELEKKGQIEFEDEWHTRNVERISTSSNKESPMPNSRELYPYVSFKLSDGTRRMMLILPEQWKVEAPNGELQAQRSQVPLILAWALSIHKAQGQTLERVKIDLRKIFEKGQAYVALSRATSQEGLQVLNFDKSRVMAHPKVAQFYNSLYNINKAMEHPVVANAS